MSTKEEALQAAEPAYRTVLSLLTPDDRQAVELYVEASKQAMIPEPPPVEAEPVPRPKPTPRSTLFNELVDIPQAERFSAIVRAIKSKQTPPDLPQCIALTDINHWYNPRGSERIVFEYLNIGPIYPLAPAIRPNLPLYYVINYIRNFGVPENIGEVIAMEGTTQLIIFGCISNRHASFAPSASSPKKPPPPAAKASTPGTSTSGTPASVEPDPNTTAAAWLRGFILGAGAALLFLAAVHPWSVS
jgi:hypothetical protein